MAHLMGSISPFWWRLKLTLLPLQRRADVIMCRRQSELALDAGTIGSTVFTLIPNACAMALRPSPRAMRSKTCDARSDSGKGGNRNVFRTGLDLQASRSARGRGHKAR